MNAKTQEILCGPKLLEAREKHFARLERLFAGERLEHAFVLCGIGHDMPEPDVDGDPKAWVAGALDTLARKAEAALDPLVFRPLCLETWYCGVHFTDRLFGAKVFFHNEQWWSEGLKTPIGQLKAPDLKTNAIWLKAQALTRAMLAANVTAPLMSTQVLGEPLNQTFNLYKQRLLTEFYDNPEAVRRDLAVVTQTLCALHRWYRQAIPDSQMQPVAIGGRCQPRGHGQMCGCSTQLVSGGTYREFILPCDVQVLSVYPHGGLLHLCGSHAQHIPAWREMKSLRAVQLNDRAANDLELYFKGLRADQIIYFNPTDKIGVMDAMEITGGRRIVIVADVKEPLKCKG